MAEFLRVYRADTRRVALVSPSDLRYGPDEGLHSIRYFLTDPEPSDGRRRTYIRQGPGSPWAVRVKVLKGGETIASVPSARPVRSLLRSALSGLRVIPGGGAGRR